MSCRNRQTNQGEKVRRLQYGLAIALLLVLGPSLRMLATGDLIVGRLELVEASESVPYPYWYYVPESALDGRVAGLVWHATPGGTDPDDSVFWSKFDLPRFLACSPGWSKPPISLPETYGLVLFSIAIPRPNPSFYASKAGSPLGYPDTLNSLGSQDQLDDVYCDPDLKALESIDDLKRRLSYAGVRFDPRLFVTGVYGGAEWAHRFALLHPASVRAVAPVCGNVYTMPLENLEDEPLAWPLGLAGFESLGRGALDWETYLSVPYYVTTSSRENLWYNKMTPEEQGIGMADLDRYVSRFGAIPPEREASFAAEQLAAGVDCRLIWSEGGHGWIDSVRARVFEFFAGFDLSASP